MVPDAQLVKYGYWYTEHEGTCWVSTTMGSCEALRDSYNVFDLSRHPGWPKLLRHSPEAECESVKARAKEALERALASR
jgi:hypothetical protein